MSENLPGLPSNTQPNQGSNQPKLEDNAQVNLFTHLAEIYTLTNQAIQQISQVDKIDQALTLAAETLAQSPFIAFQFLVENNGLTAAGPLKLQKSDIEPAANISPADVRLSLSRIEHLLEGMSPLTISLDEQATLPSDLVSLLNSMEIRSAALIPVWRNGRLYVLYVLGAQNEAEINPLTIQPYVSLAGQVSTAIDKVQAMAHLHRRVAGLQSLASISQAISVVTDLTQLYELIHEKITQVMGDIDLAITLYDPDTDTISIPYAYEAGEKINLPPFPLGQGLTSVLIRTQQPLMLVEDTEQRAIALGAKIAGAPAKSWLGVPLIVSNQVQGAIIVQDTVHEHRFDMDDLRLLTTLAAQVAITIRNVHLFQEVRERADRERMSAEISARIWSSPDIENIARTALEELCFSLRASHGSIHLSRSYIELSSTTSAREADRIGQTSIDV